MSPESKYSRACYAAALHLRNRTPLSDESIVILCEEFLRLDRERSHRAANAVQPVKPGAPK